MHLDDISLPQVIVSPNYDASSWKIFSRWSVQLLDELPFLSTDDIFIGSHVSYTIIDWLMHNNARDKITLRFISFFKRFLSFMSFILPFFIVYIHIAVFFLSFMSFIMSFLLFAAVRIAVCIFYRFLSFLIVCLSFFSFIFQ